MKTARIRGSVEAGHLSFSKKKANAIEREMIEPWSSSHYTRKADEGGLLAEMRDDSNVG